MKTLRNTLKPCLILSLALLAAACGEDAPKLGGTLTIDPAEPLPERPATVTLDLTGDGAAQAGARVVLQGVLNGVPSGFAVDAVEVEPGIYRAENFVFTAEGSWSVTAAVSVKGASASFSADANVSCGVDRGAGALCCGIENCGGDLWCDANQCSDAARPDGVACTGDGECQSGVCGAGLCSSPWDMLGTGDGSPGSVTLEPVINASLSTPSAVAFSPDHPNELWIASRGRDQLTVIVDPMGPDRDVSHFYDRSRHFLEEVVALSFGNNETFATCGESRNTYDDIQPANDFMGPVLWPSNARDFVIYGPDASAVHLDMLHNSPNCMGIAADGGNTFFAFNGLDGVLDWYDFQEPHGDQKYGGEDHRDGIKRRYTEVELGYRPGVPSHMAVDPDTGVLYIADTGNSRILKVDVSGATDQGRIQSFFGDGILNAFEGVVQEEIVPPGTLEAPSGLVLHQGVLFVSDYDTGMLYAFKTDGTELNKLDTGLGGGTLGGLTAGPDQHIYFTDMKGNQVLRVVP